MTEQMLTNRGLQDIDTESGEMTPVEVSEEVKLAKLQEWQTTLEAVVKVKPLIEKEQELRKEVMGYFFPAPKKGTNKTPLPHGWTLKCVYKIDYKIDEAALPAAFEELRKLNVNPDVLVRTKYELDTKAYTTLSTISPEAAKVFDAALISKPGSPSLELIAPKVEASK